MSKKLKTALLMAVVVVVCLVMWFAFGDNQPAAHSLSLSFRRYGDELGYRRELAFLRLTNASDIPFLLTMVGNTNTFEPGIITESSYMVHCAFMEQSVGGAWTNFVQLPAAVRGNRAYLTLAPFSSIMVRVPLLNDGRRRKIGVVSEKVPRRGVLDKFFSTSIGRGTMTLLPRSMLRKLSTPPATVTIWCEKELSCVNEPADGK